MGNQLDIPFDKIIDMGNTSKSDTTLYPNIYSTSKPQVVYTNKEPFNECNEIHIFVQNLDGRILTLSTAKNTSILDCKKSIFAKVGIDIDEQIIYYEGKELSNNKTIYDYNINNESTINLSLGLKGGDSKCCCLEWTGCCFKSEWNGCCCVKWTGLCCKCEWDGCCCIEWTGCCIKCECECNGCCCLKWTGLCCKCEKNGNCCAEWTGCCVKCEWNGFCCCSCRDNYKCCCAPDACCLYPEAPGYCAPIAVCYCIKNSTCGFCCGGGEDRKCITAKINSCQCNCCSTE